MIRKFIENWRIYFLIFLALLALAIWSVYLKEPDQNLHIFVLDVGQGDAILIQKGDYQILVDGGPDNSVIAQIGKVMPVEDREIEKIILTHPHADHVSGLVDVLERYKVDKVQYNGIDYNSGIYKNFLSEVKNKNIPISTPKIGEIESVFDQGKITFLWPGENVESYKNNLNNTSEVFRFDYGNFSALFPGDCEVECWQGIITDNKNLITNLVFLKAAHHGSKNGSNEDNIGIIRPKIAVISLSKDNKFSFPHKETMDLLQKIGADIYRTDINGTVDISTEGKSWRVE